MKKENSDNDQPPAWGSYLTFVEKVKYAVGPAAHGSNLSTKPDAIHDRGGCWGSFGPKTRAANLTTKDCISSSTSNFRGKTHTLGYEANGMI